MNYWKLVSCLLVASSALALAEDDLPLPVFGPLPDRQESGHELLKPTAVIRPPTSSGPVTVAPDMSRPTMVIKPPTAGPVVAGSAATPAPTPKVTTPAPRRTAREIALTEIERRSQERMIRQQIAEDHSKGNTTELRQLIVMGGLMDNSVGRSPTPPATNPGDSGKVALIGIPANDAVVKNLEPFFGTPLTPDSEQRMLEVVKAQMDTKNVDVRIAGWWPKEGVMALSVTPRGSGS